MSNNSDGRINAKDREKLERLYGSYRQMMLYKARQYVQDERDAEDAVQEAFVRVLRRLYCVDENNVVKTKAFLLLLTRLSAIDIYRKRKRDKERSVPDAVFNIRPETPLQPIEQENRQELIAAIGKLPPHFSKIILLFYANGHDCVTIGELLSITPCNARKRLTRARKKLSVLLIGDGLGNRLSKRAVGENHLVREGTQTAVHQIIL